MGARAYICRYDRSRKIWQVVYSHWGAGEIKRFIEARAEKYYYDPNYRNQDDSIRREMELSEFKDFIIELVGYEVKEKGEKIEEMTEEEFKEFFDPYDIIIEMWVLWKDDNIYITLPNITNNEKLKWCFVFKFIGFIEAYRRLKQYETLKDFYLVAEEGYKTVYYKDEWCVEVEKVEKLVEEEIINKIAEKYVFGNIKEGKVFFKEKDGDKVKEFVLEKVHIIPLSRLYPT